MVVVARMDPVEHRLEPAAHDRERRAQLVRDVGEERAPLRVDRAEARAHRVERAGERAHVAAAPLGHARRVVAALDLRGRLDQRPDRRDPPPQSRADQDDEAADAADEDDERGERAAPRRRRSRRRATRAAQTPAATIAPTVSSTSESISAKRSMKRREGRVAPRAGATAGRRATRAGAAPCRLRRTGLSLPVPRPCGSPPRRRSAGRRGRVRVVLDLAADVLDVGVDRSLVRLERHALDGVEQLRPREDPPRLARELEQQPELGRREIDAPVGDGRRASAATSSSTSPARTTLDGRVRALGPPQHRADARHELPGAERLGDVVVGAELEPDERVRLVGAGGEHDDRHGRLAPDGPRHVEPVELRAARGRARPGRAGSARSASSAAWPSRAVSTAKPEARR